MILPRYFVLVLIFFCGRRLLVKKEFLTTVRVESKPNLTNDKRTGQLFRVTSLKSSASVGGILSAVQRDFLFVDPCHGSHQ